MEGIQRHALPQTRPVDAFVWDSKADGAAIPADGSFFTGLTASNPPDPGICR